MIRNTDLDQGHKPFPCEPRGAAAGFFRRAADRLDRGHKAWIGEAWIGDTAILYAAILYALVPHGPSKDEPRWRYACIKPPRSLNALAESGQLLAWF